MLKVKNLTKSYLNKEILKDISFEASISEVIGLLGLNGAGKTTLIKIINTYLTPDSGVINFDSYSYHKNPEFIRAVMGYVPDKPALYPEMTVSEYLTYIGRLRGVDSSLLSKKLAYSFERLSLESVRNITCRNLSRGFAQRVSIAQAILHDPRLLILDEPTEGLDPEQVLELRELMREISKNALIVFSSHNLFEVANLCSRTLIINNGLLLKDIKLDNCSSLELEEQFKNSLNIYNNSSSKNLVAA